MYLVRHILIKILSWMLILILNLNNSFFIWNKFNVSASSFLSPILKKKTKNVRLFHQEPLVYNRMLCLAINQTVNCANHIKID